MRVEISPLGRFDVAVDGRAVDPRALSRRDPSRLVKLLALANGHRAHREQVIPTLIVHPTDDKVWSFHEAEELHTMVPGSKLVALPTNNHILKADEPAFATFIETVEEFVGS